MCLLYGMYSVTVINTIAFLAIMRIISIIIVINIMWLINIIIIIIPSMMAFITLSLLVTIGNVVQYVYSLITNTTQMHEYNKLVRAPR